MALLLMLALGVAMDAFAVSVAQGMSMQAHERLRACTMAFLFGLFQMLMPLLGAAVGRHAGAWIQDWDHWLAFVLLAIIGGKMLFESGQTEEMAADAAYKGRFTAKRMLLLAFATSIDAFAVGFSLGVLDLPILLACSLIGVITFLLSLVGVFGARHLGSVFGSAAEVLGGVVLIGIGIKIVIEHGGIPW